MLYYLLFWTLLGFIIHFCIIFGTNLLTGGPAQICYFMPISMFRRKGISNGVKTERKSTREVIFGTKATRWTWTPCQGRKEELRRVGARPLPRALLVDPLTCTPSLLDCFRSKNNSPEGFIPFGLRLIFLFFETLK